MKNKKLYYVLILSFLVIGTVIFTLNKNSKTSDVESANQATNVKLYSNIEIEQNSSEITTEKTEYIIYYFHNNIRCSTCHKIENYTRKVFEQNFKDRYTFKVVNIDDVENKHFITDYSLYTKSVVLVKNHDDKEFKFINLPKVWDNIRNENTFKNYLKTEMENFLK